MFAASALQAGDTVTLMLFHDAIHIATRGTAQKLVPVGPPPRFEEVLAHSNAKVLACKPCAECATSPNGTSTRGSPWRE